MIALDLALCQGCASCLAVCPPGAITLKDGQAVIAQALCDDCGACIEACPTGALFKAEIVPARVDELRVVPVRKGAALAAVGAALVFIGTEILPRALPLVLKAFDQRSKPSAKDGSAVDGKICVCQRCGARISHISGIPCRTRACPHCGGALIRY